MVPLAAIPWLRELWEFYRGYTNTAVHTAATAALAIFGLLTFVDRLFAVLAIGAYVVPPVVLYALESGPAEDRGHLERGQKRAGNTPRPATGSDGDADSDRDARDTDSDRDDGDTDSDRDDGDTDSDRDTSG